MRKKTMREIESGKRQPWVDTRPKPSDGPNGERAGAMNPSYYEWFHGTLVEVPRPVYCCLFTMGVVSLPERYPWRVLPRGCDDAAGNYVRAYDRTEKSTADGQPVTTYVSYPSSQSRLLPATRRQGIPVIEPIRAIPFYSGKWRPDMVDHMKSVPSAYPPGAAEYVNYAHGIFRSCAYAPGGDWGPSFRQLISSGQDEVSARLVPSLPFYQFFDSYLEGMLPGASMSQANVPWLESTAFDNPFDLDQEPWELERGLLLGISTLKTYGLPFDQEVALLSMFKEHYVSVPREQRRVFDSRYVHEWYKLVSSPRLDALSHKRDKVSVRLRSVNPGLQETAEDYE